MKRAFALLFFLPILLFSLDWKTAFELSEKGRADLPPLKVILVLEFHSPKSILKGRMISDEILRELSDFYKTLSALDGENFVVAISSSFVDQIKEIGKIRTFPEGSESLLTENLKVAGVESGWKIMASSTLGKLVALVSSGKVEISFLPMYRASIVQLLDSGFEDDAINQISISYKKLLETFGRVASFLPPLLAVTSDSLGILPDGIDYVFVDDRGVSRPVRIGGLKLVPIDHTTSLDLEKVESEKDLSKILTKLHSYQRTGKSGIAILIRDVSWEVKRAFLKALLNDPYVSLSLPEDLEYGRSGFLQPSSIYGEVNAIFSSEGVLKLWELFKGIFIVFSKVRSYLSGYRKEVATDLLYSLEDSTFYEAVFRSSRNLSKLLSLFDSIASELYRTIGEDSSGLPKASEYAIGEVFLKTIDSKPILNGIEDEGFWVYAEKFQNDIVSVKIVKLRKNLVFSVRFGTKARDLIGKSRILVLKLNDTEYRIYFKTWRNRIYVFKNGVLSGKLSDGFGVWDTVELSIPAKLPSRFSLELLDSRSRSVLYKIGELRLVEGR